jgi:hypothetical protein
MKDAPDIEALRQMDQMDLAIEYAERWNGEDYRPWFGEGGDERTSFSSRDFDASIAISQLSPPFSHSRSRS